jgi:hypothetical protein
MTWPVDALLCGFARQRALQIERRKTIEPCSQVIAKDESSATRFPRAQVAALDRRIEGGLSDARGYNGLRDCERQGIGH